MTMKLDPTAFLPEALMLQVLGFVEPKPIRRSEGGDVAKTKMVNPTDLAKYYHSMAKVNKRWKKLMDSLLPTICVEMDFESLNPNTAFWVSERQVPIGSIKCNEDVITRQTAIPFLFQCNTAELSQAQIDIFGGSSWLLKHQRGLQGILAQQCPNLQSLHLEISPEALQVWNNPQGSICWGIKGCPGCMCSPLLFNHAAIQTVKVSIRHMAQSSSRPIPMDRTFFTSLIQGWESLSSLTLERENNLHLTTSSAEGQDDGRLELTIESASLETFSVEKFTSWDGTTFELECPRLEDLVCSVELATVQPPLLFNLAPGCDVTIVQPSMAVTAQDLKVRQQQLARRICCS